MAFEYPETGIGLAVVDGVFVTIGTVVTEGVTMGVWLGGVTIVPVGFNNGMLFRNICETATRIRSLSLFTAIIETGITIITQKMNQNKQVLMSEFVFISFNNRLFLA